MDRDAEWVEFSHDAMAGPGPVRVRQNLDAVDGIARGDDATARWGVAGGDRHREMAVR